MSIALAVRVLGNGFFPMLPKTAWPAFSSCPAMTRPGLTHAQLQVPFRSGGSSRQRLANFQRRLANRKFNRILIVGDGSRNRLLCRATADAAGLPVASYALEGAAVGNLASQFIALGAVKDLASFRHHLAHQLEPTIYHPCS